MVLHSPEVFTWPSNSDVVSSGGGSPAAAAAAAADHLVGLVVKASASRVEDPRFESRLRRDFFGVKSYQ